VEGLGSAVPQRLPELTEPQVGSQQGLHEWRSILGLMEAVLPDQSHERTQPQPGSGEAFRQPCPLLSLMEGLFLHEPTQPQAGSGQAFRHQRWQVQLLEWERPE